MNSLNREFNQDVKVLVIPFIIQKVIGDSFALIDTLMIGGMGDSAIAAVAAAGQITFVLTMIISALQGISVYITQFFGKGDMENVKKAMGLMLLSSLAVSLITFTIVVLFKEEILSVFLKEEQALVYGLQYVSIIVYVYMLNAFKDSFANALGAIGKMKLIVYTGIIGMVINTLLNYMLIYGHFGFPAYGVKGAALATLISTLISTLLLVGVIYLKKYYVNVSLKHIFAIDWKFAKTILSKTTPLVFHEGLWSMGNMLYAVAFGHMGVNALATYQLARTFDTFFRTGVSGFAFASRVMIGKKLSKEDPSEAVIYASKFTKITIYSAMVFGLLMIVLNPVIIGLFQNVSQEVKDSLSNVLYIQALLLVTNFLNNVWIIGVFRPGGDNLYTMKLIIFTTWFVALPLVFLGAYVFEWPIEIVYLLFAFEEVSKAFIGYFRYRSQKWANNLVHDM
ncbi:MATE family efflux transporter [Bacillus sp. FJAT-42315]|uniref:MATE family efflux transporter n=1 Tax=Bacillus sp. FJAT-42315 TaxID=2014077 RepID=UPI0012FEC6B0|nr:MATE family efflux transporter [Bacillus sp. FJAT-42315]